MTSSSDQHKQQYIERLFLFALGALPSTEGTTLEAHVSSCKECQQELDALEPVVQSIASWPTDVLRPSPSLWNRLARRITQETGSEPALRKHRNLSCKLQWEEAAPGIHVKILSTDAEKDRVSMLVRLDPATDYPGHVHGDTEELHLLAGQLRVDDKLLLPGDFIRAEAGSIDHRVWTDTGCTCFLTTSTKDRLI